MINSTLVKSLEAITGTEHVIVDPSLTIDGLTPSLLIRPGTREEVIESLAACSAAGAAVVPAGLMRWLETGNPIRRADVVLSLTRMSRIIDYSPADLTAVVEAGLTIGAFNEAARAENQWLPLDPPGSPAASLGAIAACASSGPLRFGFGTPRDYVIGLRLAHIDGAESKSGGRVVKNVAGYDMNKLYVGSYGTLAVITELTIKLRPVPESDQTLIVTPTDGESLGVIGTNLLASEAQPASIYYVDGISFDVPGVDVDRALAVRFLDNEEAVRHQADLLTWLVGPRGKVVALNESEAVGAWGAIANLDCSVECSLKLSLPLSATAQFIDRLSGLPRSVIAADIGAGIIRVGIDIDDREMIELVLSLRAEVEKAGGTLFVERASASVRRATDAWGEVGPTAALMKAIKARFDPRSLLNPGRFVAGI